MSTTRWREWQDLTRMFTGHILTAPLYHLFNRLPHEYSTFRGVLTFGNGSRIIAFSANPQAMAVYGGDVGLDEFAKHPNARLLCHDSKIVIASPAATAETKKNTGSIGVYQSG
mgnify:CR=1 FL=1